ncbi:MaoC like domain [Klebsiella michiganensis]|nr:MaoC like domain [Klebsiella michiganensis]
MTLLHYTLADAQQWAAFSGDENPIHFDLAAARQMGAGQLSVHGMRALLDVKRDAHSRLYRPERYVKCQVRLRRPNMVRYRLAVNARASQNRLLSATSVSNPREW